MPNVDVRKEANGQRARLRWRFRSAAMVREHKQPFQTHGMQEDSGDGHTLETEAMDIAQANDMKARLQTIIARNEPVLSRYQACYDILGPHLQENARPPCIAVAQHESDSMLARAHWQSMAGGKRQKVSKWTHKATLEAMSAEVNAKMKSLRTDVEREACVDRFMAEINARASEILLRAAAQSTVLLAASIRAHHLRAAKSLCSEASSLLAGIEVQHLFQALQHNNTFTGLSLIHI